MKQGEARLLISQLNYYAQTMMRSVAFVDGMPIDPTAWKSSPFFSSSEDPRRFDTSGSGTDRSLWDSALRIIRLTHQSNGTVEGQGVSRDFLLFNCSCCLFGRAERSRKGRIVSPNTLHIAFTIAEMRKVSSGTNRLRLP